MAQNSSQTAAHTDEIEKIVLDIWMESNRDNVIMRRLLSGAAAMLGLSESALIKYMPKFLPDALLLDTRRDQLAVADAVLRIAEALMDYEMWDAYHESHAPSAYRYAAAVISWLYLFAAELGGAIPLSCPLYDARVRAAVAEFLATLMAYPIYESLHKALVDATEKWIRTLSPERREVALNMSRERREEEALLHFCSPP
jgi:hypothetical protein